MKLLLFTTVCYGLLSSILAECPNACSKNGLCGKYDMCTCFKNFKGNDCSEKVCPFANAHVDTAKGDLNMNGQIDTSTTTVVNQHQVYPQGTTEQFPNTQANEAHFYMECANKGTCSRSSGQCKCFDGYEGSACQRVTCPASCSGHGTCQSMKYLAENAGGTLFNINSDLGSTTYSLWDGRVSYGCKCDPGYYNADCSAMRCPYGVDPLYMSNGNPLYETIQFQILGATGGTLRVRFFDKFGEAYVTPKITVGDDTGNTAGSGTGAPSGTIADNFAKAFNNLPNAPIRPNAPMNVICDKAGSTTFAFVPFVTGAGTHTVCQFVGFPGKLRLAQYVDSNLATVTGTLTTKLILPTTQTGEDSDLCTYKSTSTIVATQASTAATLSAADANLPLTLKLYKVGVQYFVATIAAGGTAMTMGTKWGPATVSGGALYASALNVWDSGITATAWTVGSTSLTTASALTSATIPVTTPVTPPIAAGATLFIENVFFIIQTISSTTVTVNKPFPGTAAAGVPLAATPTPAVASAIYVIVRSSPVEYEYVSECSGRGLCDASSGVCKCFKGYTDWNCDMQDTLAA